MYEECERKIGEVWEKLCKDDTFRTPDDSRGKDYTIEKKEINKIKIYPQNISIRRMAFVKALSFLLSENHDKNNKCEIRSNNDRENAGPLCFVSREENNDTRCINYIVPILKKYGLIEVSGQRPNKAWILK